MPEFTPEARAFIDHWKGLRHGAELVPSSRDFLDYAAPKLQPFISFNDIDAAGHNVVSLYGTGLIEQWGRDLTGRSVEPSFPADVAARFRRHLTVCAQRPCGMWEVSKLATSSGRVIMREITTLPLAVTGRIRIARFHHLIERLDRIENFTGIIESMERCWIDVGKGVPDEPPELGSAIRKMDLDAPTN